MRDHDGSHGARVEGRHAGQEKAGDDSERPMELRLTRKLAEVIDGVDLKGRAVGDIVKLPASEARLSPRPTATSSSTMARLVQATFAN